MTESTTPKQGDRIRLTYRGVVHTVWGTHTVCGKRIADYPVATVGAVGRRCVRCSTTPVVTFTFASGRQDRYFAQ